MAALLSAICFEGLGRKYLPRAPALLFYFLKDGLLVAGLLFFGVRRRVLDEARGLYRGFGLFLVLAALVTFLQVFNPAQDSLSIAIVGLRSYWLWWLAPLVIASALSDPEDARRVVVLVAVVSGVVAAYAIVQFAAPPDADINTYALYEGREMLEVAVVPGTGRARVAATFSFLSGFADFVGLVPALLLSLGLDASSRTTRLITLSAAATCAAVMPMTGSRQPVVISLLGLSVVAVMAGLHRTRMGRRVIVAGAVVVAAGILVAPEALQGLETRFQGEDTGARIAKGLWLIPPVAMAEVDYPPLGIGTGMQQNARAQLGGALPYREEEEYGRYLIELGIPGFLLYWIARFGLVVGLVRAARKLVAAGQRGLAGAAAAFAAFTMIGNLVFDHVWQSLYFLGVGLVLHSVVAKTGPPRGRLAGAPPIS